MAKVPPTRGAKVPPTRGAKVPPVGAKASPVDRTWLNFMLTKGSKRAGAVNLGLTLLPFAPGLVRGLGETVAGSFGMGEEERRQDTMLRMQGLADQYSLMRQRRALETQRLNGINQQLLQTYAPELYQQVLAGRALPPEATVIGGRPRHDLLQDVAARMSAGQFQAGGLGQP